MVRGEYNVCRRAAAVRAKYGSGASGCASTSAWTAEGSAASAVAACAGRMALQGGVSTNGTERRSRETIILRSKPPRAPRNASAQASGVALV